MAVRSPVINVMANAALKAARALNRDFGEVEQLQVSVKGPSDFVSTADLRAATKKVKPTTLEWFSTAKNFATYANDSGQFDEVLDYLKRHRL